MGAPDSLHVHQVLALTELVGRLRAEVEQERDALATEGALRSDLEGRLDAALAAAQEAERTRDLALRERDDALRARDDLASASAAVRLSRLRIALRAACKGRLTFVRREAVLRAVEASESERAT